jgi:hypothetical protein
MHTSHALGRVLALLSLAPAAFSAPAGSPSSLTVPSFTEVAPAATPTLPYASDDPNAPLWSPDTTDVLPEPIRGQLGAPLLSAHNVPVELENPDLLAPPTTDSGTVCVGVHSPNVLG